MNAAAYAVLLFLGALPPWGHDWDDPRKPTQMVYVAVAIADAGGADPQKTALLAALGWVETGYALHVHDGHCRSYECDHGRARGPWQAWRNGMSEDAWAHMVGIENVRAQAYVAAERIALGLKQCGGSVRGALARYIGLPCGARGPHLEERFRWYQRALRALVQKPS